MPELKEYPKTTRLYSPVTISEKLDGSCCSVLIDDLGKEFYCQSKSKIITPQDDYKGFAKWVEDNKETILEDLGPGDHYGEFYGAGLGRSYGLKEKYFALFNTRRFSGATFKTPNLQVVPILYEGPFTDDIVQETCEKLADFGSVAVPGFMRPEGVCVFWTHDNTIKKVPFDK